MLAKCLLWSAFVPIMQTSWDSIESKLLNFIAAQNLKGLEVKMSWYVCRCGPGKVHCCSQEDYNFDFPNDWVSLFILYFAIFLYN